MGALSLLIALETSLYIQARRGELPNSPDVEKLRKNFKELILSLATALVLIAIAFYISVFYPPPPPCNAAPSICNYLMSI
jgi:hypothetical protein